MDRWQILGEFIKIEAHKTVTIYIVTSSIDPVDLNRAKRYDNITNYIIKYPTVAYSFRQFKILL